MWTAVEKTKIGSTIQELADRGVYSMRTGRSSDSEFIILEWEEPFDPDEESK